MKKNLVLVLFSLFVVFSGTTSHAYFVNGDFELGSGVIATGWTATGNDSGGGWRSTGGNPAGNFILNSYPSSDDPTVGQTVTGLTAGYTYTLSGQYAYVYPPYGNNTPYSFGIFMDGLNIDKLSQPGAEGVWGGFSYDIVAPDADILFEFKAEIDGSDTAYRIDNISLTLKQGECPPAVPEPATMLLLGIGLMGIAGVSRKKS